MAFYQRKLSRLSIVVGAKALWDLPWLFVSQMPFGTSWFCQIWSGWPVVIGPTDVSWNSKRYMAEFTTPWHRCRRPNTFRLQGKSALKLHTKGPFSVLFNKNTVLKFQDTHHKRMPAGEHSGSSTWCPQSRPLRIWLKAPQRPPGVNSFWKSSASFPTLHGWKRGQSPFCTFEWTPMTGSKGLSLDWRCIACLFLLYLFPFMLISFALFLAIYCL